MKIATWNINGLRARQDFLLAWLRERQPDLVGLQELKLSDEQFPHEIFEAEGYRALAHGQKAWNGVAVLYRGEAELVEAGLPGQEDAGSRLISVDCAGLRFATVYCPNGKDLNHPDFARKLAWFDALAAHLEELKGSWEGGGSAVLCGDFNICPSDLDSWAPERMTGQIFHSDEERARMQTLFDLGLTDLFRALHPEERAFSWWDYRGGAFHRGHGLRIDFLLGTSAVRERLRSVEIDREWRKKKEGLTASDHAPVMAELD